MGESDEIRRHGLSRSRQSGDSGNRAESRSAGFRIAVDGRAHFRSRRNRRSGAARHSPAGDVQAPARSIRDPGGGRGGDDQAQIRHQHLHRRPAPPARTGQTGRDARPHLQGARDPRRRQRLDPGRGRNPRLSVRTQGRQDQRAHRGAEGAVDRGTAKLRGRIRLLPAGPFEPQAAPEAASAHRHRLGRRDNRQFAHLEARRAAGRRLVAARHRAGTDGEGTGRTQAALRREWARLRRARHFADPGLAGPGHRCRVGPDQVGQGGRPCRAICRGRSSAGSWCCRGGCPVRRHSISRAWKCWLRGLGFNRPLRSPTRAGSARVCASSGTAFAVRHRSIRCRARADRRSGRWATGRPARPRPLAGGTCRSGRS